MRELYASGIASGLPPHQLAVAISKLYSATLSIISTPERMNYLMSAIRNTLFELKLISASQFTELAAGFQNCLNNDVELLSLLEIIPPKAPEVTAIKIQDDLENKLVKYLDHFSFFIEVCCCTAISHVPVIRPFLPWNASNWRTLVKPAFNVCFSVDCAKDVKKPRYSSQPPPHPSVPRHRWSA